MTETTENRVKKAGYPAGTAQALRDRCAAAAKRAARYRQRLGR